VSDDVQVFPRTNSQNSGFCLLLPPQICEGGGGRRFLKGAKPQGEAFKKIKEVVGDAGRNEAGRNTRATARKTGTEELSDHGRGSGSDLEETLGRRRVVRHGIPSRYGTKSF
jgi:hypothetical protein